jgi:gamma-carbonic anhydrase
MKPIVVGKNTIIGDRVMLHVSGGSPGYPLTIGDGVIVSAGAIVHGCTLEDGCVIGEGAQVLDGAVVQKYAKVAAGSIVMKGKVVPTGQLWSGVPAKYQRDLSPDEIKQNQSSVSQHVTLAVEHATETSKSWEEIEEDKDRLNEMMYISDDMPKLGSDLVRS